MINDIFHLPIKMLCIGFFMCCFLFTALAVLFNYTNHSLRNNYEAYALGIAQYAQKNAGFNAEGASNFEQYDAELSKRHRGSLPAEVIIGITINNAVHTGTDTGAISNASSRYSKKIITSDSVGVWQSCDKDGNITGGSGAIGVRLQKGETFTVSVIPYYRELNTFSKDLHNNKLEVDGKYYDSIYKGKEITIKDVSHGYIKENNVTKNNFYYIKDMNSGYTGTRTN